MEFQHELIIPNEGLPFKLFLFEGNEGNYIREKHWHTSVEIFAVLEGTLTFYLNEEAHPLGPGEFVIINSNEIHSIHAPERNQTAVLQIPLNQFEDYFTAQRYIRFARNGMGRREEEDRELAGTIRKLYHVYASGGNGYEYKMMALFYEVLYLLVTNYRETEVCKKEIQYSRHLGALGRITSYMREHYAEELRLSEVAERFGYSPEYLSRMFKKYAKVNFKTYMQDIRSSYAYRDLMNTDKTIAQIALEHGFCGSRAFSKEFYKRYGLMPSAARTQQKKAASEEENVKKVL